jgi:DNA transposition AAA+ family ATPase
MLKLLHGKTQGKVGHLDKILRKAAILALKNNLKKIDEPTLKEVLEYFS